MTTSLQKKQPFTRNHLIRDAIGRALYDVMERDPSVHLFGEGAAVKIHYDAPAIEARFPDRVHTLPISEDANVNFAVGASLLGVKPVVDIITADFLYRAMDSICNTAAKLNFVTGQEHTIVIRAEFLIGGPTTGQRPEALFAHIPGLRVVVPSRPGQAYSLMRAALEIPGVSLIFEDRMIEDAEFDSVHPFDEAQVPFGKALAQVASEPAVTIITYGVMRQRVQRVLRAHALDSVCDLVDLASLYPWDIVTVLNMAQRSGRVLIVEPDITYGGIGAEIACQIVEALPGVRIKRLGAKRTTIPASPALHAEMLPTEKEVLDAIRDPNW